MNIYLTINIIIGITYLLFLFISYKKGFIYEVVNLLYTFLSIFGAWFISPVLASVMPLVKLGSPYNLLGVEPIINTIIYFVILLIAFRIIGFFIMPLFKSLTKIPLFGKLNKIFGLIIGFINASIIVILVSMLLSTPLIKNGNEIKENTLFKYIDNLTNITTQYFVDNIDLNKINKYIDDFNIESSREAFKKWLNEQEYFK